MTTEEIEQLRATIAVLEAQRLSLGEVIIETALAPLREKLAGLTRSTPPDEERKRVSVLFADLVGFTAMSETLDPEEVHAVMNQYFGAMTPALTRHGGTIEKYIGDAVMALFGVPQAVENHEEMAVRAALAMQGALAALNERLAAQLGFRLALRIGVNTGLVLFGAMGGRAGEDFAAVGDAVNLAARLQVACPVDQVLVSSETARPLQAIFDFESPRQLTVKGKAEPVITYVAIGERAHRERVRGVAGLDAPMLGRDAELLALQQAFEDCVTHSHWETVAVVGEPGIGKTRLRREFAAWIAKTHPNARLLTGRCYPHTQATPYYLVTELVRGLFHITSDTGPEAALARVAEELAALAAGTDLPDTPSDMEQRYRLGSVASVLGFALPYDPLQGLQPDQRRSRTFLSLERLFLAAAAAAPSLIVAEDLQWADTLSLAFVERLIGAGARGRGGSAALLLVVSRPLEAAPAPTADAGSAWARVMALPQRTLNLQALSPQQAYGLIAELLDKAHLPPDILALLLERAQGNPFFVEEILRSFIDDGTLARDAEGGWRMTRAVADVQVPDTVQGVLMARLDRLPADDKRVAQRAAIIGRTFWQHLLTEITADPSSAAAPLTGAVEGALARLELRQLVLRLQESQISDDWEWLFRHVLTQEVAYASVPRGVRRRVHAQVAAWLEARGGELAVALVPLIAYHYDRGNVPPKAALYLRRAGEQAAAQFANDQAAAYFSRALELLPEADLTERHALLRARAAVYDLQGARPAQARDLDALAVLADRLGDGRKRAEAAQLRSCYAFALGDYAGSVVAGQQAVALAQAAGAVDEEGAGRLHWGRALMRQASYPLARAQLEQAWALALRATLPKLEADSLRSLGVTCDLQGEYAQARAYQEDALQLYRASGDRRGEGHSLNSLGIVALDQSDLAGARGYFEQFRRLCREVGDRVGESMALGNLGLVTTQQGDYAAARAHQEQALQLCRDIGTRYGESSALANLALITLRLGSYSEAQGYLAQALQLYRAAGDRQGESETLAYFGLLQHHLGDEEAAVASCQQALTIAEDVDSHPLQGTVLAVLGRAELALLHLDEASSAYARALAIRDNLKQVGLATEARAGLAGVALARGDIALARTHVEEILRYLTTSTLDGTEEPFEVYLTCYRVLEACQDPRSAEVLRKAVAALEERAARISDPEMRRSFLENVAAHRALRLV